MIRKMTIEVKAISTPTETGRQIDVFAAEHRLLTLLVVARDGGTEWTAPGSGSRWTDPDSALLSRLPHSLSFLLPAVRQVVLGLVQEEAVEVSPGEQRILEALDAILVTLREAHKPKAESAAECQDCASKKCCDWL